ncbi:hypothetical protein LCGC14_1762260 [marine sediment metagenome]|uniref:Uncharacterized protein n=1 Tax=marine sediment metagenome TaxID=412755 RepID=A0A0F9JFN4_9ZZZZ
MPYIKKEDRERIDELVEQLANMIRGIGHVNYAITKFLHTIIQGDEVDYALLNAMIGVLECAKLELYRMVVAKYEDKKRMKNGPVSDLDAKSLEDVR